MFARRLGHGPNATDPFDPPQVDSRGRSDGLVEDANYRDYGSGNGVFNGWHSLVTVWGPSHSWSADSRQQDDI